MTRQVVDAEVSRAKFEREVAEYRARESEYRGRGWLLLNATFPTVTVVMCAARLTPPAVITGIEFDFTNYDEWPPSVRFIDPFTGDPYLFGAMPTSLKRRTFGPPLELPGFQLGPIGQGPRLTAEQPLMQASSPDEVPFLCLAGVREYHDHPAHSGDSWDLYRDAGAGRLLRLLEVIDTYGVRPISDYNVALVPRVTGFVQNEVPE